MGHTIAFDLTVSCPACLAPAGKPCHGPGGHRQGVHNDRRSVARTLRETITQATGPVLLRDVYVDEDLAELLRAYAAVTFPDVPPTEDTLSALLCAAATRDLQTRVSLRRASLGVVDAEPQIGA